MGKGPLGKHWKIKDTSKMKWKRYGESLLYWKRQALLRDDYTCQICSLRDPEIMEVDHIIPIFIAPAQSKVLSNLRTLCPNCHVRKSRKERAPITNIIIDL